MFSKKVIVYILNKFGYEIKLNEYNLLNSTLKKFIGKESQIFVDIGAYKGEFTDFLLKTFPKAKIICFEPFNKLAKELKNKYSENKNIKVLNYALSDAEAEENFFIYADNSCNSLYLRTEEYNLEIKGQIKVKTKKLDSIVTDLKINEIDLLKIDVEGNELKVLKGAENTLNKIKLIYTEIMFVPHYKDQKLFCDIQNFLTNRDFVLYDFYFLKKGKLSMRWGNALFLNKKFF